LGTRSRFAVVGVSGPQVKIIHIKCVEVGFWNIGVSLAGAAHISGMEESGSATFRHFSCSTDYFERRFIVGAVETIFPVGKKIGAGIFGVDSKTALLESAVIGYIHEDWTIPQASEDRQALAVVCAADFKELHSGILVQLQERAINELHNRTAITLCGEDIEGFNREILGNIHISRAFPGYGGRTFQHGNPCKCGSAAIKRLFIVGCLCCCENGECEQHGQCQSASDNIMCNFGPFHGALLSAFSCRL
jgi:hypothetical protein